MLKVLVLGGSGMLGHKVFQVLDRRFETYATFRAFRSFPVYKDRAQVIDGVDATDFTSVIRAFVQARPDVVINCIGIVKQCYVPTSSFVHVNALFPHQLADLCKATGTRMFHISTDCVFSGDKGGYTEADIPDAQDINGRTKLLGEINSSPGCLTIRTSVIGRDSTSAKGLLEWFLKREGKVTGYKNVIYSGFTTQALAQIIGDLIVHYPDMAGLYQIASEPISKYDLLIKIRDAMHLAHEIIAFDTPVCDRSLDATAFIERTNYTIPTWDEMIAELAADATPYGEWRRDA